MSVWAIVQVLATGFDLEHRYGLSLLGLVATYFGSGIAGGLVFGLLRPLAESMIGAAVLGLLVMLPVGFVMTVAVGPGLGVMTKKFVIVWLVGCLSLGPLVGVIFWGQNNERRK